MQKGGLISCFHVKRDDPGFGDSIIGVPLDYFPKNASGIPVFLASVADKLVSECSTEGILRVSGNQETVEKLGKALRQHPEQVPGYASVHDVASLLKLWLRRLPEPLIPPGVVNGQQGKECGDWMRGVLEELPELNRRVLATVLWVLRSIERESSMNRMNLQNISVCFSMSLSQSGRELKRAFPFQQMVTSGWELLGADGTDFVYE